tara:strand:+ start:70 stop:600 length:531 start_codon:yes stop_codon:yes gene_type:complete
MTTHICPTLPYDLRIEKGKISHIYKNDWEEIDGEWRKIKSEMGKGLAEPDEPINKAPLSPLSVESAPTIQREPSAPATPDFSGEAVEDSEDSEDIEDNYITPDEYLNKVEAIAEDPKLSKITQNKVKRHLESMELPLDIIVEYTQHLVSLLVIKTPFNKAVMKTIQLFEDLEEQPE